ncbi:nucleoside hydrolase-like domain-containing protein [Mariniflexile sp. HNIBRBA6329]|uniref:nucleoside hydrolase-like domain-containing protein n=1 Tax=Mariniflexile sp. HNIBRBA6329 TaxID=3373088 RepID=UPI0037471823
MNIEGIVATEVQDEVNPKRIEQIVEAYGKVRNNLELHETGFSEAEYLKNASLKEFQSMEWMACK